MPDTQPDTSGRPHMAQPQNIREIHNVRINTPDIWLKNTNFQDIKASGYLKITE